MQALRWDVFCRVVDNFGDIGVCWRLAADLAARGQRVRLWVDDAAPLRWMAPDGAAGVDVQDWPEEAAAFVPGDVVIEAFGCNLPSALVRRMTLPARPPLWINLEYLSAEDFVERSHRLGSPLTLAAAAGLRKFFFYPGFTPRTGGLIREPDLVSRRLAFDAPAWLAARGVRVSSSERVVSLFCYEQPVLPALLAQLSAQPTVLLATAGHAARQVIASLGPAMRLGNLRASRLELSDQREYDHLLWASDLNFVRGEDSFVRAQWAGKPFVWHIYPQGDGAHVAKLDAFLMRSGASPGVHAFCHAWNTAGAVLPTLPELRGWQQQCVRWRDDLLVQTDLTSQLIGFAIEPR